MIVTITPVTDIRLTRRLARATQGKGDLSLPPSLALWEKWLHSEESQIKVYALIVTLKDIPYCDVMHFRTHEKNGCQFFVRTQRPDSTNPVPYDRDAARQDAPVTAEIYCNPLHLIAISRKRLCTKAGERCRAEWQAVKDAIAHHTDPYMATVASVMLPDCEYRGGVCHQTESCGLAPHWRDAQKGG